MNKDLVEKVRRNFDLNIYETKVWLALLSKGDANIAQVHELSKVPRSRIYDVLKSLETKGFCLEKLGRPIKYAAVEPTLVVDKLKRSIEEEAKEKIEVLDKVRGSVEYQQLESLHKNTINLTDKIGTALRGRNNLLSHLADATKNANSNIVIVSTPRGLERKLNVLMPTLANKIKKGVKVTIGIANSNSESLSEELQKKLQSLNLKAKQLSGGARFCIIDDNVLLITSEESSGGARERDDNALWLKSEFFANTLAGLLRK